MQTVNEKSECQKDKHFKSCCCGCVNRVELLDNDQHPIIQVGWGCTAIFVMEGGAVFVGDFEHGLCEMWSPLLLTKRAADAKR